MTPTERALKQQLESVQATVQNTTTGFQTFQQQQMEQAMRQREAQVNQQIESFAQEQGPDGKLLHPHFEHVANDMTLFIQAGLASDLETAYEQATRINPDVQAARERERQAADAQLAREKAEKVRKAANTGVVSKSRKAGKQPKTMREQLEQHYDKLTA